MLTNPNTVRALRKDILELTALVHAAGGLVYYDGANLNAIMGVARPGDMGFDVCHLNLHKTFATPHGGGGPGSGPVGCKSFLAPFLPGSALCRNGGEHSIGQVRAFLRQLPGGREALAYLLRLETPAWPRPPTRRCSACSCRPFTLCANYLGSWEAGLIHRPEPPASPETLDMHESLCSPWRS